MDNLATASRAAGFALPSGAALSQLMLPIQEAAAKGGEYGLIEGKAVALAHPLAFAGLYLFTLFTGYQGYQWRRVRELGDELKTLQDELKALEAKVPAPAEGAAAPAPTPAMKELTAKIVEVTAQRKELISGNYKDKHWVGGSMLLAGGVTFAVEGAFDTYFRVGKLFPGPHLFAGAGIVVLWAMAASLVPAMQKGNDAARSAHIALNTVILGLFTWQLPTGFDILNNVWNKVAWVPAYIPPTP